MRLVLLLVACAVAAAAGAVLAAAPPEERVPLPERAAAPVLTVGAGDGAVPAADAPVPRGPVALGRALVDVSDRLDAAVDRWRRDGDPAVGGVPRDVALLASFQQRCYRLLTDRPDLLGRVVRAVPARLRGEVRDNVLARRELGLITSVRVGPPPKIAVGPAQPADVLRGHYRAAWRRFGVAPPLLAAVNFVETAFGRLRNRSVSGARGPMQFLPATWRAYGMGGDISDPRDAIMGAANYLRASGAPGNEARALFAYNPSSRYVSAVSRYVRQIRRDPRAFYAYYAWQVYVDGRRRTPLPG